MSNQSKITPLPWHTEPEEWTDGRGILICSQAGPVALIDPEGEASEEDKVNAAFIVQACNSHQDLIDALKDCSDLLQQLKRQGKITRQCESVLTTATAAIKKATSQP